MRTARSVAARHPVCRGTRGLRRRQATPGPKPQAPARLSRRRRAGLGRHHRARQQRPPGHRPHRRGVRRRGRRQQAAGVDGRIRSLGRSAARRSARRTRSSSPDETFFTSNAKGAPSGRLIVLLIDQGNIRTGAARSVDEQREEVRRHADAGGSRRGDRRAGPGRAGGLHHRSRQGPRSRCCASSARPIR